MTIFTASLRKPGQNFLSVFTQYTTSLVTPADTCGERRPVESRSRGLVEGYHEECDATTGSVAQHDTQSLS